MNQRGRVDSCLENGIDFPGRAHVEIAASLKHLADDYFVVVRLDSVVNVDPRQGVSESVEIAPDLATG